MLTKFTLVTTNANKFHSCRVQDRRKMLMSGEIPTTTNSELLTSNLANLLTQPIYTRSKSPQKGIPLSLKAWNMPVLF